MSETGAKIEKWPSEKEQSEAAILSGGFWMFFSLEELCKREWSHDLLKLQVVFNKLHLENERLRLENKALKLELEIIQNEPAIVNVNDGVEMAVQTDHPAEIRPIKISGNKSDDENKLVFANVVSWKLKIPIKWLKTNAEAGMIPCLKIGKRMFFSMKAVEESLLKMASVIPGEDSSEKEHGR